MYVESVIDSVFSNVENAYLVFIPHDIRSWDNNLSDYDYSILAMNYLKEKNIKTGKMVHEN